MNNGDLNAKGILSRILYSEGTIESFKVGFSFSFFVVFLFKKNNPLSSVYLVGTARDDISLLGC